MNGPVQETLERTSVAQRTIRTLIVDDSPTMARSIRAFLDGEGRYEVIGTASDGREAVERIGALSPELVLMDVRMPVLDGIEATWTIKSRPVHPAVIIVTVHDTPSCRALAEAAGADGFITKIRLPDELPAMISELFGDP